MHPERFDRSVRLSRNARRSHHAPGGLVLRQGSLCRDRWWEVPARAVVTSVVNECAEGVLIGLSRGGMLLSYPMGCQVRSGATGECVRSRAGVLECHALGDGGFVRHYRVTGPTIGVETVCGAPEPHVPACVRPFRSIRVVLLVYEAAYYARYRPSLLVYLCICY